MDVTLIVPGQLSVKVGGIQLTWRRQPPLLALRVMVELGAWPTPDHTGAIWSMTVTVKLHTVLLPSASVKV